MTKTVSRLLALVLALVLAMPAGAAFAAEEEPVKLTIGVPAISYVINYEDNWMTKQLEEKLNLDLSFVTYAPAEMIDKLNLEVSSGGSDLPDIIIPEAGKPGDATVYSWALQGMLVPIQDYLTEDSNLIQSLKKTNRGVEGVLQLITSPDGNIYGFPIYNESIGVEYQGRYWINKDWMEKLDLEIPTNPDELYNVLKAFRTQDPNGNGKADELPILSYAGGLKRIKVWLVSMFGNSGYTYNYLAPDDEGTLYATYTTDYYREALRYIRKLVAEDLFSPLSFTYDVNQFTAAIQAEDQIVGSTSVAAPAYQYPEGDQRRLNWTTIPPFADAEGEYHFPMGITNPNIAFMITKNCKNVEAAVRLGDEMSSEYWAVVNRFGIPGQDWITPPEGSVALYASMGYEPYLLETGTLSWSAPQNTHWHGNGPVNRGYFVAAGMCWNGDPLNAEYQIAQEVPKHVGKEEKNCFGKLIFTEEENDIVAETLSTINSYVDESFANFVTGVWDIEKDWDAYINELEVIGLEEMLETMQVVYDRMYK